MLITVTPVVKMDGWGGLGAEPMGFEPETPYKTQFEVHLPQNFCGKILYLLFDLERTAF